MPEGKDWDEWLEGCERKHTRNLARYAKQIDGIFAEAAAEAARIGHSVSGLSDKPFSFDDYPMAKARMDALVESMHDDLLSGVENGIDAEWALANGQADELVSGMLAAAKLGNAVAPDRWLNNHAEALEAFKRRKIAGLGLSDRVWNYTGQFREEIEMALDLGIRSGRSAAEMSRDVRQYLRYPDKLFRRVRDEHGNLRLSKAAKAFHPGQGVYRSSYKNALRLTATETNIAYRTADFLRVQGLDFVVGIEVRLSNNHTLNGRPFLDICDELAGKYPKDFKFTGWHPFCRCHSIKILKTEEEFFADEQRLLAGEDLSGESVNRVGDVPPRFKEWVRENRERIGKARAKGTEAYFLRDNKAYVDGILDPKPNALQIAAKRHAARTPEQIKEIRKRWEERRLVVIPKELEAKGAYLNGENYNFDKRFFALLDKSRPVRLEILDSDSGSYSSFIGDLVHIAGTKRGKASPWECKAVIYHEYGHCIDAQRDLWKDADLIKMRNNQIKRLKKKQEYAITERKWNQDNGGWYYERVKKEMSMVEYVDTRLKHLMEKIFSMKDETFKKRGITKMDVIEQIGSTSDTIKSLVVKYGFGHSNAYFKRQRAKETEYLAHAFENAFLGNRVFQKVMPDIYDEMIRYIKNLKVL